MDYQEYEETLRANIHNEMMTAWSSVGEDLLREIDSDLLRKFCEDNYLEHLIPERD